MLYGILASRSSKIAQVISESCHPSRRGDDRGESIMRTVASEIGFRERRKQVGMGTRAAALRKAHRRTLALELLEPRVLLATLPAITPSPNTPLPIDLAQTGSAPSGGATNAADGSILSPTTGTGTIENESSPT